jgi:hypothetical protein
MSRKIAPANIMAAKVMMAVVSAVLAISSPALAASNGTRDNGFMSQTAQYCMPQYDDSGAQRLLYC